MRVKKHSKTWRYYFLKLQKALEALQNKRWYHGLMPREEIEDMLVTEGDFIIRRTEIGKKIRIALSVKSKNRTLHILLRISSDGKWALQNLKMTSVTRLIKEHVNGKIPVQKGIFLKRPVPRPDYYILHDHVKVKEQIGAGAFGEVLIGDLKTHDGNIIPVAIKKLKGQMSKIERKIFMKEAKIMRRFNHQNIVNMLGVAAQQNPVMIILELCPNGALNSKLRRDQTIKIEKLLAYATDAARGMTYLSGRRVIHRDIAARNCLIGKNDEVKISDFGLSVADQDVISVDKLLKMPVRWLAPETLRLGQFSTKSDVWSFGVMMWEIFTRCKSDPYPGMTNAQARIKILSKETPMVAPEGSPPLVNKIMGMCFIQEPERRATFEDVFKILAPYEKPPQPEGQQEAS